MPGDAAIVGLVDRLASSFEVLTRYRLAVVAVSGGTDSTALLHALVAWRARLGEHGPALHVLTVDHGLRAEAEAEARRVIDMARALGVPADGLRWSEPKPATGLQAAARAARYALFETAAVAAGAARGIAPADIALLTAHTADDQAETVLMRLARGSGPDGLAGMRAARRLQSGITLHRPLLDVRRADLESMLRDLGVTPIEDPSNADMRFERVRWRTALARLEPMGLTAPALALSARRTAEALDLLDALICDQPDVAAAATIDPYGMVSLAHELLARFPAALTTRLITRAIAVAGGQGEPVPLGALEAALAAQRGFTLAGAEVDVRGPAIRIWREMRGVDTVALGPGTSVVWDNRFVVSVGRAAPPGLTVGPLGADALKALEARGWRRPARVPAKVLWTQPVVCRASHPVAAPTLGIADPSLPAITARHRFETLLHPPPAHMSPRVAAPSGA
jgi:tRNA(Ile)-lysidine synthase